MKQDYKPFVNSKTNWLSALGFVMCLLVSSSAFAQFYNGSQMEFGKNRVQYEKTDWFFYRFDRFDVYFYLGGGELAEYTMRASDRAIRDLEKTFDFTLDKRFQIIIYNKLSEQK